MVWLCPLAANGPVTLNVDLPPGKWKAMRLKNLPKDAFVAVEVRSTGEIVVALVDENNYRRFPTPPRPLFLGRVEKKLSFSVTVPAKGHYYVIFDNRLGPQARAVTVTVRAARGGEGKLDAAEKILRKFEQQLHQIFVFDPFPIRVEQCGVPKSFVDKSGIVLCAEYPQHLYNTLGQREKAENALLFTIFHEVGHILLAQWNYPFYTNEEVADEFATVLMVMLNQKERAIGMAEYFVKNPSASEAIMKLFRDDRHPLSVQRARNILRWLKDPQLARRWQTVLVPHMQTTLLKGLRRQPTAWTDLPLVRKELTTRRKTNPSDTHVHPPQEADQVPASLHTK